MAYTIYYQIILSININCLSLSLCIARHLIKYTSDDKDKMNIYIYIDIYKNKFLYVFYIFIYLNGYICIYRDAYICIHAASRLACARTGMRLENKREEFDSHVDRTKEGQQRTKNMKKRRNCGHVH